MNNLESNIQDSELGDPQAETRNPEPETRNPNLFTRSPAHPFRLGLGFADKHQAQQHPTQHERGA